MRRGYDNPVFFAQDFLDFEPHAGQVAWLLRTGDPHVKEELRIPKPNATESTLHAANRWGKTQVIGVRLLHRAFYQIRPDEYKFDSAGRLKPYVAVNVALSLDQAMIGWNYALALAMNSPRFSRFVLDQQGTPFPKLIIGNQGVGQGKIHSEVWARSTAKGARFLLGKTFNFLTWDECAFEPDGAEILDGVIRMRMVDQSGELELISSPSGLNWFHDICILGRDKRDDQGKLISDPTRYSQRGETFDNVNPTTGKPNIDFDRVRQTMQRMTDAQRLQNVYGEFAEGSSIFDTISVQSCYRHQDYAHLLGMDANGGMQGLPPDAEWVLLDTDNGVEARLTRHHDKHLKYVIGVDLARKRDQTCIVVLQVPDNSSQHCQVVFFELLQSGAHWAKQFKHIQEVYYRYHSCPVVIDSTSMGGDMALETLQNEPYGLNVSGYNLAGGTEKTDLLLHLQQAIQEQRVRFPYLRDLVNQLIYYRWDDKNLSTDAVFGLALAWEAALQHGMGESSGPVLITSPDLSPICVSRDSQGNATLWEADEDDDAPFNRRLSKRFGDLVLL